MSETSGSARKSKMSFLKKKKDKTTSSPRTGKGPVRKGSAGSGDNRKPDGRSRPSSSQNLSDPTKGTKPKTPQPKKDDDDDFWGTDKNKGNGATPSPQQTPSLGGMPASTNQGYAQPPPVSVPPGYIPTGFALDQFGQTVMVMVHAQSGQQFYQPVPPSMVQQYGFTTGRKLLKNILLCNKN